MKALGMFIFGGSMSIGVMNAGFTIDRVLEISDEMLEENAKHFIHNYPEIPVIAPSEWNNVNNADYIDKLMLENYDLVYSNPPCSGLSNINRNASADNEINKYMYKFANVVKRIRPKTFLMENAPTLLSRGKRVLNFIVSELRDYNIVILRDYAGNHGVAMRRQRTMLLGFHKDWFGRGAFPILNLEYNRVNVQDIFAKHININVPNMEKVPERTCKELEGLYDLVSPRRFSDDYFS